MKHTKRPAKKNDTAARSFKIEGRSSLMEFVRYRPHAILSIHATDEERKRLEHELRPYELDIAIQPLPRDKPQHGKSSPVAAHVRLSMQQEVEFFSWLEDHKPRLVLALDHVTDPRNLGAIVRSAAFFGVEKIIIPERRQVQLTDASVSTAQGGFARTDLVCVVNLGRVLESLKSAGYWILGAAMDGEPLEAVAGTYDFQALVLGAEDKGISAGTLKKCDRLVALRGPAGGAGGLDSLNVAVAGGILLHALTR